MRKRKDPETDLEPDPYLRLMDPVPGVPKTRGSCGSGSPALNFTRPKAAIATLYTLWLHPTALLGRACTPPPRIQRKETK